MTIIYVVTSGDYSDYMINAVYSDKDKADEYRKNFKCDDVKEYELNPSPIPLRFIQVDMKDNGDVCGIRHEISDENISGILWYIKSRNMFSWNVQTTDEERAIKVANEKRIQILANNCWNDITKTRQLFQKD